MMAATANIENNGRCDALNAQGNVSAVSLFKPTTKLSFNLSKRLAQSFGQDRERIFAENRDISVTNLCDALAFAAFLRQGAVKRIERYNPTKLRDKYQEVMKVRLHTRTVENYVRVLLAFKMCFIEDGTLHFCKLKSQTKRRNFKIEYEKGDGIKQVGRKIAEYVVSATMRAIGYVSKLQDKLKDPADLDELKDSRHRARRLKFDIERFADNGVSCRTLALRFNTSKSYVIQIIKNCVNNGILYKIKRCVSRVFKNAVRGFMNLKKFLASITDYYTYYSYNPFNDTLKLYNVSCNRYIYNPYNIEALN